jgi:predicted amidohydrolase
MTHVAAIQMTTGADVARNLASAEALLREASARKASIAALPENFAYMGLNEADKLAISEAPGSGPIQEFAASLASELRLWIVAGTIPLRLPEEPRVAAACLVYDDRGRTVARYDKIHLFDVDIPGRAESYRESTSVRPGAKPVVVDTPAGRLGLAVCYDLRFPELFRELLSQGAEWFCLPSAFTAPTGRAHWETLLRARAIENLSYVVAPAQSGFHENGRETHGDTMIVDPWGRVLARLPRGTGVVTAELDIARQREVRQNFPATSHRRLLLPETSPARTS